jgi:hypothetical protein
VQFGLGHSPQQLGQAVGGDVFSEVHISASMKRKGPLKGPCKSGRSLPTVAAP